MIQLPVSQRSNTTLDVPLEGVTYSFLYRYSSRNKRLYLSISLNGLIIISGIRLVENGEPISGYALDDFTRGRLYVFKSTESNANVTLGNIGIDKPYWLVYVPAEELAD